MVQLCQEQRLNLYLCGHYATEVHGVKALAAELSAKFGLPWNSSPPKIRCKKDDHEYLHVELRKAGTIQLGSNARTCVALPSPFLIS